ncbi:MAG: cell division protein SepF [bacterium]
MAANAFSKIFEFFSDGPEEEEGVVEKKEVNETASSTQQSNAAAIKTSGPIRTPMTLNPVKPETVTMVRHPRTHDECREVGRDLKSGKSVVLDLSALHDAEAQKFIDFVSGVVFALDGELCPVHGRVYIAAPKGIKVDNKMQNNDTAASDDLGMFSAVNTKTNAAVSQDTYWMPKQ